LRVGLVQAAQPGAADQIRPPPADAPVYLAQHLLAQQDFTASRAGTPQQSSARAQQEAAALQQRWAPPQHDLTRAQQSLPCAQQPSLTAALQQAEPLPQQASFCPQQSFGPAFSADWAGAANSMAAVRAAKTNSFTNMILSTKDV
jgi:hypothetical protein